MNVATRVDEPLTIALDGADDGLPNPLSYIITALPINGSLADVASGPIVSVPYELQSNGRHVVYEPEKKYCGSDSFTYKVNDGGTWPTGGDSNIATVSISVVEYFTELFNLNDNDLDNTMLTFIPDGSSCFYSVCRDDAAGFATDVNGGTILPLGDDDYAQVNLSGGKQVGIYGSSYGAIEVGSNGYITFGSGDSNGLETLSGHFAMERISALFDDLDPNAGGIVSFRQMVDRLAVTFEDVLEKGTTNFNSFQIEMFFEGTIRITYLNIDAADGLAGLSDGNGLPADFLESDLSDIALCADFDISYKVDMNDAAALMSHWLELGCPGSVWCEGTDLDRSGSVDFLDFGYFNPYWRREANEAAPVEAEYVLYSIAADDGRVWDDRDDGYGGGTGVDGNSVDSDEYALRLGDWGRYGYRDILSFDTSVLPADAAIISARLELTKGSQSGSTPFGWGGGCVIDIADVYFGSEPNLEPNDWESMASAGSIAEFLTDPNLNEPMISTDFNSIGLSKINLEGRTQTRVYFVNPRSGGDSNPDYIGAYSGENLIRKKRPKLIINCTTRTPTVEFSSEAAKDGRVRAEFNGGSGTWEGVDANSSDSDEYALRLGDWAPWSYRDVLSFDTSTLPDDCTILSAKLELTRSMKTGIDPFTWGGSCVVDISSPYFGDSNGLEAMDWQAAADASAVAEFLSDPGQEKPMRSTEFNINGLSYINKTGTTQLRVYFTTPTYGSGENYLSFWSGESAEERETQPRLIIRYFVD
jgi:hypothetical protein